MDRSVLAKWVAAGTLSVGGFLSVGSLIEPHEGTVKNKQGMHIAYIDAVGIPTVCYGQTGKDLYGRTIRVGMPPFTEQECTEMLLKTVVEFEKEIDRLVKVDYRSDYQKAALISFVYNVGVGNFASSTLLKDLNKGLHDSACSRLSDWVYAKKKKLNGLVKRREEEMQWCMGNVPQSVRMTYTEITDFVKNTSEKR